MTEQSASSLPARLPQVLNLLGVYATYVTAALVLLVIAGDLAVLLRHPPVVGLLAVLVVAGPLVAMLLSTFASYINYYGTWRILRGKDAYDAGQDLKSHAADIPQALQDLLAGRRGCLPAASTALLFVSVLLAAAANVPPSTPALGALGAWQTHAGPPGGLAAATPTPTPPAATPVPTATATAMPTAQATATATTRPVVVPVPTATATPVPVPTATATPSGPVINFTISPSSKSYSPCANNNPPVQVPPVALTLDNSKSTVAVSWQVNAIDSIASGAPWATITPVTSGTVAAGRTQTITVNPASILCKYSPPPMSWHITIGTTNAGTYTFTYNVS